MKTYMRVGISLTLPCPAVLPQTILCSLEATQAMPQPCPVPQPPPTPPSTPETIQMILHGLELCHSCGASPPAPSPLCFPALLPGTR